MSSYFSPLSLSFWLRFHFLVVQFFSADNPVSSNSCPLSLSFWLRGFLWLKFVCWQSGKLLLLSTFTFLRWESFKTNNKNCGLIFSADNPVSSYSCLRIGPTCTFFSVSFSLSLVLPQELLRKESFKTDRNVLYFSAASCSLVFLRFSFSHLLGVASSNIQSFQTNKKKLAKVVIWQKKSAALVGFGQITSLGTKFIGHEAITLQTASTSTKCLLQHLLIQKL